MRNRYCIPLALLISSSFTLGPVGALRAQDAMPAPANDTIRKEDLRSDLFFLAGDRFRGRLTDSPENALAADFIQSRFARLGLKPAGPNESYFQPYMLMKATLGEGNTLAVASPGAATLKFRPGSGYYPHRFSANATARGALVFAGFGIVSPERQYDDYGNGAAVRGRFVLAINHEPGERDPESPFDGVVSAQQASPLEKAVAAQEKGAIGMLFVTDAHNHPGEENFEASSRSYWPAKPPNLERYTLARWSARVRIPVLEISPDLAATLVRGSGRTLEELSRSAETRHGITPIPLPNIELDVTTSVSHQLVPDRNVVAAIEGADPKLKEEAVIICAHFDHNGMEGTAVLSGADDNGSGVVALIDIAEAYAEAIRNGERPRRTVLFAAWNSEERGLLGAWAYTEQPIVPLARTVALLNMDMIGRNEEVPIGGGARFRGLAVQTAESNQNAVNLMGATRSPELRAAIERANDGIGLELKVRYDNNISQLLRRSDQWPFIQRGVPAVNFTTGLHPDYHTQYDRPEKINYDKMEKIARLVHRVSWVLANADTRPAAPRVPATSASR
jgi:hypothetical protein